MAAGMVWFVAAGALALLAACKEPAASAPKVSATADARVPDARVRPVIVAKRVDPPASCDEKLAGLQAAVRGAFVSRYQDEPTAMVQLRLMPHECRGASWYLAVAKWLRRWPEPIDIGGVEIADPTQAMKLGLAAGDDVELLGFVAFVSGLGGQPPLPDDACERARRHPYVCAHAALRRGDPAQTLVDLDRMNPVVWYPDQQLLRARALIALGRAGEAPAAITRPNIVSDIPAEGFGVVRRERQLMRQEVNVLLGARSPFMR